MGKKPAVCLWAFLDAFCLKLALYCWPMVAHPPCGWHWVGGFSHRKPSWTWSKGFVLPSETPTGTCGSVEAIPGDEPEPAPTLIELSVAEYLQTSWLAGMLKIKMPLLCDSHGDLCPLYMCLWLMLTQWKTKIKPWIKAAKKAKPLFDELQHQSILGLLLPGAVVLVLNKNQIQGGTEQLLHWTRPAVPLGPPACFWQ